MNKTNNLLRTILSITLVIALTAGYPLTKAMAQYPATVQNLQQAVAILKPEHKEVIINHDPFKPIIVVKPPVPASVAQRKKALALKDRLADVRVIGIARMEQEYRAYITVGKKGRVVNVQDKIRKYTITHITIDQIVLVSGNTEIIKKRGKL